MNLSAQNLQTFLEPGSWSTARPQLWHLPPGIAVLAIGADVCDATGLRLGKLNQPCTCTIAGYHRWEDRSIRLNGGCLGAGRM